MELLLIIIELAVADLILGGDNAIVISMATKNLPEKFKLKASVYGAFFAIILRVVFILIIIAFGEMHIMLLNIFAGILLIKIASDMMSSEEEVPEIETSASFAKAVKTIVVADAVMSLDNAIVIASIAEQAPVGQVTEIVLIVFALLISFPIILFGARILTKIIEKFRLIVYVFGLMLIHIGVVLASEDKLFERMQLAIVDEATNTSLWIVAVLLFCASVGLCKWKEWKKN